MKFVFYACILCFVLFLPSLHGEEGSAKPKLAPGILTVIPPDVDYDSVFNRADMVEVIATLPKPDASLADDVRFKPEVWAKDIRYARDVWCLQFSFKPVRIIEVDIPNKQGTLDKTAVWYLVYNIKNPGPAEIEKIVKERTIQTDAGDRTIESVEYNLGNPGGSIGSTVDRKIEMPIAKDTTAVAEIEPITRVPQTRDAPLELREMPGLFSPRPGKDVPVRFVPQFLLATDRLVLETVVKTDPETGKTEAEAETTQVVYADQVVPIAIPAIMKREGMTEIPKTTVSIAREELKSGDDLWGVAMWTGIDPRINRFSIYASGLTNAYRWSDAEGSDSGKVGEGRSMEQKVLKTNWWRIGDRYNLNDSQIQYGRPGELDYEWIFR